MEARDYDPLSPVVRANPYPYYEVLRETAPVHRVESRGLYAISRYDDVAFVARHSELFSNAAGGGFRSFVMEAAQRREELARYLRTPVLLATDPPVHTRLRGLVSRAFTPRRIAELEPRIRSHVRALLARLPRSGEFDFIGELAGPLPVIVISELLGIEPERRDDFKRWSDAAVGASTVALGGGDLDQVERYLGELRLYLEGVIEARRREPRDDLISALVDGGEREDVLTPDEVASFCRHLLVAGNETTSSLLANALLALLRHPEQLERLTREPLRIPDAIEETLRYDAPLQGFFRQATRDVEVAGTTVPAGAKLLLLFGSANRDPRKFPEPDRFDPTRSTQGHLAFGHGIHFCLGAPLARLEAKVALEELLAPDRRLSFAPGQAERYEPVDTFFIRGPKSLRLKVEPATL